MSTTTTQAPTIVDGSYTLSGSGLFANKLWVAPSEHGINTTITRCPTQKELDDTRDAVTSQMHKELSMFGLEKDYTMIVRDKMVEALRANFGSEVALATHAPVREN